MTVDGALAVRAPLSVARGLPLPALLDDGEDVTTALALSELLCDGDAVPEFDARGDDEMAADVDSRGLSVGAPVAETHALIETLDDGERVSRGDVDSSAVADAHAVARVVPLVDADFGVDALADALPHAEGVADADTAVVLERAPVLLEHSVALAEAVCEPRPPALDETEIVGDTTAVGDGVALTVALCDGSTADGDAAVDADAALVFDIAEDVDTDALCVAWAFEPDGDADPTDVDDGDGET